MKLSEKQIFVIKATLGIMFAVNTGNNISYVIANLSIVPFIFPFFIRSFSYLVCVLIIQWILFSGHLPKRWFVYGIIGSLVSAFVIEQLVPLSPYNPPSFQYYVIDALRYFVMGLIAVIPQGYLLRKYSYVWILLNGLGWGLNQVYQSLLIYPAFSIVPFYMVILITITNGLPLGLVLSWYLYKIVNGEFKQSTE